jgi:hypothetical protein
MNEKSKLLELDQIGAWLHVTFGTLIFLLR